jgi:EmrB/QacA subfamily drug resistance transporter
MQNSPSSLNTQAIERWALIATIVASSMAFIDGSALSIVQPDLQAEFNANYNSVAWVVNGYSLMLAALILVGGSLGDLYGRKRVFMAGIVLFALASVACGVAPSIETLIIARIVQGIGGALMIPGSLANLTAVFPPEKRGAAIGTWSTFSALMVIVGPVVGGQLAALEFWRGVFFINVPLALLALYAANKMPESRDPNAHKLDVMGAVLATLGLAGLTYGFTEAPTQGWSNPLILITALGGVVALIAFVVYEGRAANPMMPLHLFRSRSFSGTNLLTFFLYAALGALPVFLPLNLRQIQGYPPEVASLAILPLALALIVLSRLAGGLVARVGARTLLVVGPAIAGIGFFWFGVPAVTNGAVDYWVTFFPATLLLGIGMGFTVAPLTTTVMNAAPSEMSGTASGINNAVSRAAGVLAVAIFTALALTVFGNTLSARAEALNLPETALADVRAEAPRLADALVPQSVPTALQADTRRAIQNSFVDAFRLIAWGCAGLAWLSVLAAASMIEGRKET